jgi:predicted dehydrogenase
MTEKLLRIGVVGLGHLGQHHARIYNLLSGGKPKGLKDTIVDKFKTKTSIDEPLCELTALMDIDKERAQKLSDEYNVKSFDRFEEMIEQIDAVSIAAPTINHHEIAKNFLSNGISVLIEKPITKTIEEAEELIEIAKSNNLQIQVGHVERFNPAVIAAAELITKPMFIESHRLSSFPERSVDIDVILDLMIHDIDIIISFVKSRIKNINSVGVPVLTDKIDIANARLEFESGCVANVTASRVSMKSMRKMRIFQPDRYVSLDYLNKELFCVDKRKPEPGEKIDFKKLLSARSITPPKNEPLFEELKSFIQCVKSGSKPLVSGDEGRNALEVAYRIINSINRLS